MGRAGVTGDIGTHAYHLANFVTGLEMTCLRAEFHVCGAPKAMEDTAFMHVRYEGNVPGTLWVTQAAPGNYCGLRLGVMARRQGWNGTRSFRSSSIRALGGLNGACRSALKSFENVDLVVQAFG